MGGYWCKRFCKSELSVKRKDKSEIFGIQNLKNKTNCLGNSSKTYQKKKNQESNARQILQIGSSVGRVCNSWWGGRGFNHRCGRLLPTGWVSVSIMWPAEIEVMVSIVCHIVWQQVKLSHVSVKTGPWYSLSVDQDDWNQPNKPSAWHQLGSDITAVHAAQYHTRFWLADKAVIHVLQSDKVISEMFNIKFEVHFHTHAMIQPRNQW